MSIVQREVRASSGVTLTASIFQQSIVVTLSESVVYIFCEMFDIHDHPVMVLLGTGTAAGIQTAMA